MFLIFLGVAILGILFVWRSYTLGKTSQEMVPKLGIVEGHLSGCPVESMNCVSSETENKKHKVEPIVLIQQGSKSINLIVDVLTSMGGMKRKEAGSYVHFEFSSKLFGFVDDVEIYLKEDGTLEIRSASRVGKSDLGMNRKRVEQIRQALLQMPI